VALTVALTGGTGFVGAALVRELSAMGCRLRLLVRRPPVSGFPDGVEPVIGSLEESASLSRLVEGADAVVHAAGAIKAIDATVFERVNRDGAAAMAEAAAAAGVRRFLLISSIAARSPVLSAYAASKRAGESECQSRFRGGLTILRPPVVYGPGDRETLPMFRAAALGIFPVPGPPEARLSFIHVADCAAAVGSALAAAEAPSGVFEIDDGKPGGHGWPEIAVALAAAVGRRVRPIAIPAPLLRLAARAASATARISGRPAMLRPDKINELRHPDWVSRGPLLTEATGWRARFALADGFRDAATWYRARGWLK
jgi:nucleoside-diphosphate-sugar epimerase